MNELPLPVLSLNGEPKASSKLYEEFIKFDGAEYCIRVMFYGGVGFEDMQGKQIAVNIDRVEPSLKGIGNVGFALRED